MKLHVLIILLFLSGCGVALEDYQDPNVKVGETPTDQFATTVKPVLTKNCSGTGCHSSSVDEFLNSGAAFKASAAKTRIEGNTMPVPNSPQAKAFTAEDKTILLNYLSGN